MASCVYYCTCMWECMCVACRLICRPASKPRTSLPAHVCGNMSKFLIPRISGAARPARHLEHSNDLLFISHPKPGASPSWRRFRGYTGATVSTVPTVVYVVVLHTLAGGEPRLTRRPAWGGLAGGISISGGRKRDTGSRVPFLP